MNFTSLEHLAWFIESNTALWFTLMYSNTSAARKFLFACNCADAFTLFALPPVGAGNTKASALVSVLTTPLVFISSISSKPAFDLATALELPPLPVIKVAAADFRNAIAASIATLCAPVPVEAAFALW